MNVRIITAGLAVLTFALAACGESESCLENDRSDCPPTVETQTTAVPPVANLTASPTPYFGTPTPLPTVEPPTTPTPMPPSPIPPDPRSVTPHPTSVPVTQELRPRVPVASDIKLGSDGKYYAEVDGCRWDEYGRFPDSTTPGTETVNMNTPCLPDEGLSYNLTTGEFHYFIS